MQRLNDGDLITLRDPALLQGLIVLPGGPGLLLQRLQAAAMIEAAGLLLLQQRDLGLEMLQMAAGILDGGRQGALPERNAGAGGIQHADRLVRQLSAGQIAV